MRLRSISKRLVLLGGVCGLALTSGGVTLSAMAQESGDSEAVDDADEQARMGTITVTTRKREETLLEVPVSVSAFSQDDLNAAGIVSLEALSTQAPGFQFLAGANGGAGRGNEAIRFRGLSLRASQPSNRPGAIFWDGGFVSHGAGILPLIDLERVEVIKGPQTAFFGRNTFTGAVNFIPKEPGDEFSGRFSTSYAWTDESGYDFQAAFGGPLSDNFGVRVSGIYEKVGADWEFRNGDPLGGEKNVGGSIVTTWDPLENLSLKMSAIGVSAEDGYLLQGQFAPVGPGECNRTFSGELAQLSDRSITRPYTTDLSTRTSTLFCGTLPDFDEIAPTVSAYGTVNAQSQLQSTLNSYDLVASLPAELSNFNLIPTLPDRFGSTYRFWRTNFSGDYDLPNNFVLSAQYAVGESASRNLSDRRHGSEPLPSLGTLIRAVRDNYAEIRLTSPGENRLRYMIGTSYYEQDNRQAFALGTWRVTNQTAENFGIFGSVEFDVTDRLTASFEGRWHDDTLTIDFSGVSGTSPVSSAATIVGAEQSYDAFMPRAILSYEIMDDMNVYASYSESQLQGVASNALEFTAETGIPVDTGIFTPTQKNQTFEIGLKQSWNWLDYSAAIYQTNWENQVFGDGAFRPASVGGGFVSVNLPGEVEVTGIDFEFGADPTDWLDLSGGFSYNDVEFVDFAGTGSITGILTSGANPPRIRTGPNAEVISVAGNRPRSVPKWTGNFSATTSVNELLDTQRESWIRLDGIYQGDFFSNDINFNVIEGHWKLNLRAGMNITDNTSLELFVDNLTDDLSYVANAGTTSVSSAGIGAPGRRSFTPLPAKREAGVRFVANF